MDMTMDLPPVPDFRADAARTIAIIGAGFSGTMAAIHLRRSLQAGCTILLLERSGSFARGIAYAESRMPHMLNVRAANMGAFADDPTHFERWATALETVMQADFQRTEAGLFATRRIYGRYLRELLQREMHESGGAVRLVEDEILTAARHGAGWQVTGRNGRYAADSLVLACGGLPCPRPCDGTVFHNPWSPEAVAPPRGNMPVVIVGTGLTMADLALSFRAQGFKGKIIALSRRGLVPRAHEPIPAPWPTPDFSARERATALALLGAVRGQVRTASLQGVGWRAVIDSLRPITASLWRGLPEAEKRRLLRHLRPYWDVHRHRMAPLVAAELARMQEDGTLQLRRGRARDVSLFAGTARLTVENCGRTEIIETQRLIFATGLGGKPAGTGPVAHLLRQGFARLDPLGLGLEVTETLQVLDANGEPVPNLWALGPLVHGMFWECTAVPDIRVQAQRLGAQMAQALV